MKLTAHLRGILCCCLALAAAFSGRANAQRYPLVVLLDVSGSMEHEGGVFFERYSRGYAEGRSQMQQLMQTVGSIADRHCQCDIYLATFSSSHEPLQISDTLRGNQLLLHTPATAHGRETELDYALRRGLGHRPDEFIFIITDNKNDYSGNRSDAGFYSTLAHDPRIKSVYFVPLGEEDSTRDALVLYGIGVGRASSEVLRSLVSDFASAIHSEAVQFRPLYEQESGHPQLGFSEHIMLVSGAGDDLPIDMEGDALVLRYQEGQPLDGGLKFQLHSNLKHWRIVDGELKNVTAAIEVPQEYLNPGQSTFPVRIPGAKLNVNPGGDSAEIYFLPLEGLESSGVVLQRGGFFRTKLPDIMVKIHLQARIALAQTPAGAGLQPVFSPTLQRRMHAVKNLPEIMNAMTFQGDSSSNSSSTSLDRNIPVSRDVVIRVRPDPVKNLMAKGLLFGTPAFLLFALAGIFLLLRGHKFNLVDPAGRTSVLAFSVVKRTLPLLWAGRTVANLTRRGGMFEIAPARGFKAEPAHLPRIPANFEISNASGERGQYQLRPGAVPAKSRAHGGQS